MAVKGVPVIVTAKNGLPVRPVDKNGPLLTVSENGIGAPITLSDLGAPAVVQGLPPPYDPDAVAIFDVWDIIGVPADDERKQRVSDTIVALKEADLWDQWDLFFVTAAHAETAAYINWKSPLTLSLSPVFAPAFAVDRGFTGNGTTSYLQCNGYIPNTNGVHWEISSASVWSWALTDMASASPDAGAGESNVGAVVPRNASNQISGQLNRATTAISAAMASSIGLSGVQRVAGSSETLWKNGSQVASGSNVASGRPTGRFRVCGRSPSSFSSRQVAFAC